MEKRKRNRIFIDEKQCRICGYIDPNNVNIFNEADHTLITKLVTVYPIIVYERDPLPQSICLKCIYRISSVYNEIQRARKIQSKWINDLRTLIPNHQYIQVLDIIEHSKNTTKKAIQSKVGVKIDEESSCRELVIESLPTSAKSKSTECDEKHNSTNCTSTASTVCVKNDIENIQSILELNGCSLLTVESKQSQRKISAQNENGAVDVSEPLLAPPIKKEIPIKQLKKKARQKTIECHQTPSELSPSDTNSMNPTESDNSKGKMKSNNKNHGNEDDDEDDDNVALSRIAVSAVKCSCCKSKFTSMETLAIHQMGHLRLNISKIFEKKYLPKNMRRGRLITIQDRKCVRCLNCWRVYIDNKSILDHWTLGDCEFYCRICGKDFAQAPKMLREHVPAAHGISYRSSRQTINGFTTTKICQDNYSNMLCPQTIASLPPQPSQAITKVRTSVKVNPAVTITNTTVVCKICNRVFRNMKARNSHMRKHKLTRVHGQLNTPIIAQNNPVLDVNDKSERIEASKESRNLITTEVTKIEATTTSKTTLRGIRTKFVERRNIAKLSGISVRPLHELKSPSPPKPVPSANVNGSISNGFGGSFFSSSLNDDNKLILTVVKNEPKNDIGATKQVIGPHHKFHRNNIEPMHHHHHHHDKSYLPKKIITCSYCTKTFQNSQEYHCHMIQFHQLVLN